MVRSLPLPVFCAALLLSASFLPAATLAYWRFDGEDGGQCDNVPNEVSGGPALEQEFGIRLPMYAADAPKLPKNEANKTSVLLTQDQRASLNLTDPKIGDFEEGKPFTVECWINPIAYGSTESLPLSILHKRGDVVPDGPHSTPGYFVALTSEGKISVRVDAGAEGAKGLSSKTSVPLDAWSHIALSRDEEGNLTLRVNGNVEAKSQGPLPASLSNNGALTVGAHRSMMSKAVFFNGYIDEVRISDANLPDEELLYTAQ